MRNRAWRRYKEEVYTIRRLTRLMNRSWWRYEDVNGFSCDIKKISDYLGTYEYFRAKTISTTWYDSRDKSKYSPNRNRDSWGDHKGRGTRLESKKSFLKLLKEYGIK